MLETTDEAIFDHYKLLANFLGEALGNDYEIIVQDVREGNCCIIHMAGGSVTNRKPGSPLTDLGLKMIRDEKWKEMDSICGYMGFSESGNVLHCSTQFIKNNENLIGMFCINQDVSKYSKLSEEILSLGHMLPSGGFLGMADAASSDTETYTGALASAAQITDAAESPITERFFASKADAIDASIEKLFPAISPSEKLRLSPDERRSIIEDLDHTGFFLMKGSIQEAAKKLGCSIPTIYRYRSEIKQ